MPLDKSLIYLDYGNQTVYFKNLTKNLLTLGQ